MIVNIPVFFAIVSYSVIELIGAEAQGIYLTSLRIKIILDEE